jgi:hypothetical protein
MFCTKIIFDCVYPYGQGYTLQTQFRLTAMLGVPGRAELSGTVTHANELDQEYGLLITVFDWFQCPYRRTHRMSGCFRLLDGEEYTSSK